MQHCPQVPPELTCREGTSNQLVAIIRFQSQHRPGSKRGHSPCMEGSTVGSSGTSWAAPLLLPIADTGSTCSSLTHPVPRGRSPTAGTARASRGQTHGWEDQFLAQHGPALGRAPGHTPLTWSPPAEPAQLPPRHGRTAVSTAPGGACRVKYPGPAQPEPVAASCQAPP